MAAIAQRSPTPEIPDRLYFRIGDVARLCKVETYVLRFWESEFPQLRPNKSGTGQRLYRRREVELALTIKRLLHEEGYTIAGARQVLQQQNGRRKGNPEAAVQPEAEALPVQQPQPETHHSGVAQTVLHENTARVARIRAELKDLLDLLSTPTSPNARNAVRNRGFKLHKGKESVGTLFDGH